MKTITTGTEITFKKTGDKFTLTKTDTGFDVKQIKLSKSVPAEDYSFQELLTLYESGYISIEGFEEGDAALVKSILTNYIHTTEIEALKADTARITMEKEAVESEKQQLANDNSSLKAEILQVKTINQELTTANGELTYENTELKVSNKNLTEKNEKLNIALEAMQEHE